MWSLRLQIITKHQVSPVPNNHSDTQDAYSHQVPTLIGCLVVKDQMQLQTLLFTNTVLGCSQPVASGTDKKATDRKNFLSATNL
jgi:hypothetical protein